MGLVDKVKGLPTPLFVMHFSSKMIICFGLGVILASYVGGAAWWIIGLGVALSILPIIKIFGK